MKRFLFALAAVSLVLGSAAPAQAQDDPQRGSAEDFREEINRGLTAMEEARLRGDCTRFKETSDGLELKIYLVEPEHFELELFESYWNSLYDFSPGDVADLWELKASVTAASALPCDPVESVAEDLPPTAGDFSRFDPDYAIKQLRTIREDCLNGKVAEEDRGFYEQRYDRFQAEIRAARDHFRRAAIGTQGRIRELLLGRMRDYEAGLEGRPEGFQCRPAAPEEPTDANRAQANLESAEDASTDQRAGVRSSTSEGSASTGTAADGGLDWLLGTWRARRGGAIGFRQEADGTASGYVAELNDRARENGYALGQVFLRGCRDVSTSRNNQAAWAHSARCEQSFNRRWEGESIVSIPLGEETLDIGYYALPIIDDRALSRSTR